MRSVTWDSADNSVNGSNDVTVCALVCLRAGARRIRSATFPSAGHVDYRFKDCPAFSIAVSTSLRAQPVNSTRLVASLANLIGKAPR